MLPGQPREAGSTGTLALSSPALSWLLLPSPVSSGFGDCIAHLLSGLLLSTRLHSSFLRSPQSRRCLLACTPLLDVASARSSGCIYGIMMTMLNKAPFSIINGRTPHLFREINPLSTGVVYPAGIPSCQDPVRSCQPPHLPVRPTRQLLGVWVACWPQ